MDASKDGTIEELVKHIEANVGPNKVAVFNLRAQIGNRSIASTTYKQFKLGWRMAQFGLFRTAK